MTDKQENKLTFGIEQVHFAPLTVSPTGEIHTKRLNDYQAHVRLS